MDFALAEKTNPHSNATNVVLCGLFEKHEEAIHDFFLEKRSSQAHLQTFQTV
jgi:hypothetical protein